MTVWTGDSYVHEVNHFLTSVLDLAKVNSAPIHELQDDSLILSIVRHYTDFSLLSRYNLPVAKSALRLSFPRIPDSSRELPSDWVRCAANDFIRKYLLYFEHDIINIRAGFNIEGYSAV
jgi:hypothetical protein